MTNERINYLIEKWKDVKITSPDTDKKNLAVILACSEEDIISDGDNNENK